MGHLPERLQLINFTMRSNQRLQLTARGGALSAPRLNRGR